MPAPPHHLPSQPGRCRVAEPGPPRRASGRARGAHPSSHPGGQGDGRCAPWPASVRTRAAGALSRERRRRAGGPGGRCAAAARGQGPDRGRAARAGGGCGGRRAAPGCRVRRARALAPWSHCSCGRPPHGRSRRARRQAELRCARREAAAAAEAATEAQQARQALADALQVRPDACGRPGTMHRGSDAARRRRTGSCCAGRARPTRSSAPPWTTCAASWRRWCPRQGTRGPACVWWLLLACRPSRGALSRIHPGGAARRRQTRRPRPRGPSACRRPLRHQKPAMRQRRLTQAGAPAAALAQAPRCAPPLAEPPRPGRSSACCRCRRRRVRARLPPAAARQHMCRHAPPATRPPSLTWRPRAAAPSTPGSPRPLRQPKAASLARRRLLPTRPSARHSLRSRAAAARQAARAPPPRRRRAAHPRPPRWATRTSWPRRTARLPPRTPARGRRACSLPPHTARPPGKVRPGACRAQSAARLGAGAPCAHRPRRRWRRGPARHWRPVLLLHSPRRHQGPRLRAGRRRGRRRRRCAAPACVRPRAPCRAREPDLHAHMPGAGAAEATCCSACGKAAGGPTLACVRCAARCHAACAGAPLPPGAPPAARASLPVQAGVAARSDGGWCADPSASFTCTTCQTAAAAAPAAPAAAKPKRKRAEPMSAASSGASRRRKAA